MTYIPKSARAALPLAISAHAVAIATVAVAGLIASLEDGRRVPLRHKGIADRRAVEAERAAAERWADLGRAIRGCV